MKLLGLTCGKKMGNCEILLKEALQSAKETGDIEGSLIRLLDLDIKPCTGCAKCAHGLFQGGSGKCIIRDDFPFLDEHFMECDGLIIAAPVFVLAPHGVLKVVADRMGPSHDLYWRMAAKKIREESGNTKGEGPDERSFKKRVGAFISTGGASTPNWLSFGFPLMHLNTMPSHVHVVDHMQVNSISRFFNVVLTSDNLERARKLGKNVADSMKDSAEEVKWLGDEEGTCPVCHSNLLTVTDRNPVECPICGIEGELRIEGDRITVIFSEEEQKRSRLTIAGLKEHWDELRGNSQMARQRPDMSKMQERVEKYKSPEFESFVIPPPEKKKEKIMPPIAFEINWGHSVVSP